jgi:hypothetical protein
MSSAGEFATNAKNMEDLSSPFRETLMQRIGATEKLHHLIYSPAFDTAKFRGLASVLCVTDQRWLMVLRDDGGRVIVAESSYGATLLVELTIILLYGQLKIDYSHDGKAKSVLLHFNTVMLYMYSKAVKSILDTIDAHRDGVVTPKLSGTTLLSAWPLKFRNFSILYIPQNSQLLDGVCWEEMRGVFGRELAPAAALVVTNRHIIVIAEEKISSWFQFRRSTKYGAIISYLPLDRFTGFKIKPQRRSRVLELESRGNSGGETLDITIPPDKEEAVRRAVQKARRNRDPASNVLRVGVE